MKSISRICLKNIDDLFDYPDGELDYSDDEFIYPDDQFDYSDNQFDIPSSASVFLESKTTDKTVKINQTCSIVTIYQVVNHAWVYYAL